MNTRILTGVAVIALFATTAFAAPLTVGAGDDVQQVLQGQAGKRVTVRVRAGDELSGTVRSVNEEVVHLGELSGKEFFDAVIPLDSIDAVIVRVKDQ